MLNNPLLVGGVVVFFLIGTFITKLIVPGWIYSQVVKEKDEIKAEVIEAREANASLRDLMETKTIPLLERAMVIVERSEQTWEFQQRMYRDGPQGHQSAGQLPPPGSE